MADIESDFSDRVVPSESPGTVVECYKNPEGYAVDLAVPDRNLAGGFAYENVILRPDQFVAVGDAEICDMSPTTAPGFDAESENLRIRSLLMLEIENYIRQHGISQPRVSALLGIPPSQAEHLLSGDSDSFTADALIRMLARVGVRLELTVQRKDAA